MRERERERGVESVFLTANSVLPSRVTETLKEKWY